jgi:hypothetical protein
VAHTCNLSYSGGKDKEDHSLRPTQATSLQDPILEKIHHKKRAAGVAQGVRSRIAVTIANSNVLQISIFLTQSFHTQFSPQHLLVE